MDLIGRAPSTKVPVKETTAEVLTLLDLILKTSLTQSL
jgi:hypothetical protein